MGLFIAMETFKSPQLLIIHIGECYNAPKTPSAGDGVEFGQLILRKIIKNVATRCQI